ncbi:MAG: hypothetical protein NWF09_03110 [Candidatus Bathyarchaeota archaeon]|nr:hypothetical protein [Candidatus Bathyarchaeota archaeon]
MSTNIELEQLQNEKARLEEEARDLDEELKQLEIRFKLLREKIAIQELRKKNAAKKEAINQLQYKISLLETQLEQLSTADASKNNLSIDENIGNEDINETLSTQEDDTITVTAVSNEEEITENFETEYAKKKGFNF